MKPYPSLICHDCATSSGGHRRVDTHATYDMGRCPICKEAEWLTDPRVYRYPVFEGFEKPRLEAL
jgi:hypothetical protein